MKALLVVLLVLGSVVVSARVDAPLLMVDRSGTMDAQRDVEVALTSAIVRFSGALTGIRLLAFADRVFDQRAVAVEWTVSEGWRSGIGSIHSVQSNRARARAATALEAHLGKPVTRKGSTTNIPAALLRAGRDGAPALFVTDGVNEVPHPGNAVTAAAVIVVLCPAKGDTPARELALLQKREAAVKRWAPAAEVFACSSMDKAVERWLRAAVAAGTAGASR